MTTLVPLDRGVRLGAAVMTSVGLAIPDKLPDGEWEAIGFDIERAGAVIQWAYADWYIYGADQYQPGRCIEAADLLAIDSKTLANYASVARRFPPERRRADVSWSHHAELVGLSDADQDRLLAQAADNGLTVRALRSIVLEESQTRAVAAAARAEAEAERAGAEVPDVGNPPPERVKPDAVTPASPPLAAPTVPSAEPAAEPPPAPRSKRITASLVVDAPADMADHIYDLLAHWCDKLNEGDGDVRAVVR